MPTDDPSHDPDLGKIERAYSIQFERRTASTPAAVWDAITKPDIVSKWMGYPARIELRIGGDYFVDFGANSGENLDGVVVALESGKSLRSSWGLSVLEWKLEALEANLSGITRSEERDHDCCEVVGPAYRRAIEAEIGPI